MPGPCAGLPLATLDPDGAIAAAIPGAPRRRLRRARVVQDARARASCSTSWARASSSASPRAARPSASTALARELCAAGFECRVSRAHPAGHLVQAVGQHDDEPGVGVHRRHRRPHSRRPARQRLLPGGHAGGEGGRRRLRLSHRAVGRGPQRGHAQARRVQDVDAAGRREPASRSRSTRCSPWCARSRSGWAWRRRTSTRCSA